MLSTVVPDQFLRALAVSLQLIEKVGPFCIFHRIILFFMFFPKVILEILLKVHCILILLRSVTVTVMSITEFSMA